MNKNQACKLHVRSCGIAAAFYSLFLQMRYSGVRHLFGSVSKRKSKSLSTYSPADGKPGEVRLVFKSEIFTLNSNLKALACTLSMRELHGTPRVYVTKKPKT